jgi:hypothetical protein
LLPTDLIELERITGKEPQSVPVAKYPQGTLDNWLHSTALHGAVKVTYSFQNVNKKN